MCSAARVNQFEMKDKIIEFVINVSREGNNVNIKLNLKINLQRFHWVLNTNPIIVSEYACFFYYYFRFESIKFRSSHSQMSFKIDVLKNFAIFTGKHMCWILFLTKFQACKSANLLKRDSNTDVFL